MGTPDFAVPSLHRLVDNGYEIVGVVTQPDRPVGRKRTLTPPPVKAEAEKHGIPVLQPEKLRAPEAVASIMDWMPDLIVTAAYGQILPEALLKAPKHGCINIHASLLPKYRGGAPIHRAIINGERETGVTIMYMVKALDAGDMIAKVTVPIDDTDTVGSLHDKLSEAGSELLILTIPDLIAEKVEAVAQDHDQATYAPNLTRDDERIDWSKTTKQIYDHVRGLCPFPVAYTTYGGEVLKVWRAKIPASPCASTPAEPGVVLDVTPAGIAVHTVDGCVLLTEVQPAGKKRMSVEDYIRGASIRIGDRLGD